MKKNRTNLLLLAITWTSLFPPAIANAQDTPINKKPVYVQQDIYDWLMQQKIIKKRPESNSFFMVIPVIGSNPTAGFIFGAGLTYSYKTNPSDKKLSNITANATYSTNGLVNLNVKSNVFVLKEKLVLNGDWRYLVNTETTYGLGSQEYTPRDRVFLSGYMSDADSIGQPLKFNQVRLHETASWQLFRNFYAGVGFQFDSRYDIKDQRAEQGDSATSFHYIYSRYYKFDPKHYTTSGVSFNLLFDSRDNQINAYRGIYANINYLSNSTILGSTRNSTLLLAEYRSYHSLGHRNPSHVIAFWMYGWFGMDGVLPYLALPSIGNDQRQKTGRGYPFGTFRGENMIYAESEYRLPVSRNTGILGLAFFGNVTATSNRKADIKLFEYLRPAYGAGLRIMVEKRSRTRLCVDIAVAEGKPGLYLGAQETF